MSDELWVKTTGPQTEDGHMEGRGRDGENAPNQPNIEKNRKGVSLAVGLYRLNIIINIVLRAVLL